MESSSRSKDRIAGTKGIRRTPRDLEGAVYELQMARDKLGQTGFSSDNRIYKSGSNAEERRNRRHKDSPNRDAGQSPNKAQLLNNTIQSNF